MKAYIDIVKKVLSDGIEKHPFRRREGQSVETPTIGLPNVVFSHEMKDGFPLLTIRKMPFRSVCVELEGFLNGVTDKRWYQERKCKYWQEWANPVAVENKIDDPAVLHSLDYTSWKKHYQSEITDLGPIYGYQWRSFNRHYDGYQACDQGDGVDFTDQVKYIVETLRKNPNDRRMVCSAWNPNQFKWMALPPCHFCWGVVVYGDTLNLWWTQRSCDLMLGVPSNICSYAILLKLLAKHSGLKEGNLSGLLCDCHIYSDHLDAAKELVTREPYKLPTVKLPDEFDFWKWDHNQIELIDYQCHSPLKMHVTI